ncbi:MAG: beta-galactosidase [Candidatus Fimimonas sp.]
MHEIFIGAAYYPEMWDESEVEKDVARCKELGLNVLRVGEFAWGSMEPKEGEFHFEWLKKVVDKLYQNGIYTVMCTPSATPPRWLLNKYEETRMVMHDLVRADVSSRCHTCKTSSVMRKKNAIIVTEMAKAFLDCKGIIGWQIDNEIFPYSEGCYCENCKAAFRAYLKNKFGTVENLNEKWGMTRWSLCYDSFDDVQPPYPGQWRHPSLRKAWWDFQCEQIKTYVEEQAEILHGFGYTNVGTDMMVTNALSYYHLNEKLDVVQFNHYNPAKDLATTAFCYDFLRCVKDKPFWVTETQVGWNGSEFAEYGYRPQGACYANTMLPIAKGAEMNMYWLFRTHPNGHELAHGALYSPAGRMYCVSNEVALAANHLQKCKDFLLNTKVASKIALNYSSTAVNTLTCAPLVKGLDYRQMLVQNYYSAFKHHNVDVIDTQHSLEGYDVLVSPFLATVDENGMKERVLQWVNNGGTWIVGPMTDVMDENVSRYTQSAYSFVEDLAGVFVKYQKPIDNDVFKAKWANGDHCDIGVCFDAFLCNQGTQSLASYTVGEFASLSVVAERKVGKGKVVLVGSVLSKQDLLKLVGKQPVAEASDNVILTERSGQASGIIAVETENKQGYVVLDGTYTDLISGRVLSGKTLVEPYQTLVLQK